MAAAKIVLDTNVLISALVFGGEPEKTLLLIQQRQFTGVISNILIVELLDILRKKFNFSNERILQSERKLKESFQIIYPQKSITVCRDPDDNRVLEAAIEGKCSHIVTGDKDLLALKKYQNITILTAAEFLKIIPD